VRAGSSISLTHRGTADGRGRAELSIWRCLPASGPGVFGPGQLALDRTRAASHRTGLRTIGQSSVVVGGVAALGMALAQWGHFWIANVIYLCFVLSAVVGSIAKIVAYRRGFQSW
jgi:hypothetical protein